MTKMTFILLLVSISTLVYTVEVVKPGVSRATSDMRKALNVDP